VHPSEGLVYRAQDRNISRIKKNVLLPEEIAELLGDEKISLRFRLLYQFAIFTGLRSGEIATLHRRDVHLDHVGLDGKIASGESGSSLEACGSKQWVSAS
jgi:integrase